MHEGKGEMARFADAFIAILGSYGTLEELLEVITWAQLGIKMMDFVLLYFWKCVYTELQSEGAMFDT